VFCQAASGLPHEPDRCGIGLPEMASVKKTCFWRYKRGRCILLHGYSLNEFLLMLYFRVCPYIIARLLLCDKHESNLQFLRILPSRREGKMRRNCKIDEKKPWLA